MDTLWTNPLFLTLLAVILFLVIVIAVLADVLKGAARVETDLKDNTTSDKRKVLALIAVVPILSDTGIGGIPQGVFYTLMTVLLLELIIIYVLINSIRLLLGIEERLVRKAEMKSEPEIMQLPSILDKINASVSIEKEADILLDHNYDGIRELDNNLPPWWKYGFYCTIGFAVCYLFYYHVSKSGDLQIAEYTNEMKKAELDKTEYMKNSANRVDETNVKLLTDPASIESGKQLFLDNCSPCHGRQGQGLVGPNLTDDYWLHGGKVNDIFKTIKYGYPEKGMKSWKEEFSPTQIANLASFIKSIHGTNPAGAKAPQGELYSEEVSAVVSDSTATAVKDGSTNK